MQQKETKDIVITVHFSAKKCVIKNIFFNTKKILKYILNIKPGSVSTSQHLYTKNPDTITVIQCNNVNEITTHLLEKTTKEQVTRL